MDILPAIDLRDGKCVRLIQGQYNKQITYKDDPVAQAREFYAEGAKWLHIVDLDGARLGKPVNADLAGRIAKELPMQVELGGGIRDEDSIRKMLNMGLRRVILGTSAIKEYDWFCEMAEKFPDQLVLGLDARGSTLATGGWLEQYGGDLLEFAKQAARLPIAAIIYTDISKDGMLCGPNLERTAQLVLSVSVPIVAAGGVTTPDDIRILKNIGVAGAIIGRALYEGSITLRQALEAVEK